MPDKSVFYYLSGYRTKLHTPFGFDSECSDKWGGKKFNHHIFIYQYISNDIIVVYY